MVVSCCFAGEDIEQTLGLGTEKGAGACFTEVEES